MFNRKRKKRVQGKAIPNSWPIVLEFNITYIMEWWRHHIETFLCIIKRIEFHWWPPQLHSFNTNMNLFPITSRSFIFFAISNLRIEKGNNWMKWSRIERTTYYSYKQPELTPSWRYEKFKRQMIVSTQLNIWLLAEAEWWEEQHLTAAKKENLNKICVERWIHLQIRWVKCT